jgi:hypothetical protein
MAVDTSDSVLLWDWERFATGVPVGFDALHYRFVEKVTDHRRVTTAGTSLLSQASQTLQPFDVPDDVARDVALLYLIDISLRYRGDRQAETGGPGGDVAAWLLPALRGHRD